MQRTGPISYLISVQLSDALKVILMKSVLFLFKKLVFDSFLFWKKQIYMCPFTIILDAALTS